MVLPSPFHRQISGTPNPSQAVPAQPPPTPNPTCEVSRNTGMVLPLPWKRSTSAWRASALVTLPSMRQNGRRRASTAAWEAEREEGGWARGEVRWLEERGQEGCR